MLPDSQITSLLVSSAHSAGRLEFVVRGPLVSATTAQLREAFAQADLADIEAIGLGMGEVDRIDSHGIGLLVTLFRECSERGIALQLHGLSRDLERTLRICNLYYLLSGEARDVSVEECRRRHLQSFEYARRMMACLGEGLVVLDVDSTVMYANERACELLGVTPKEFLGRAYFDTVPVLNPGGQALDFGACPIAALPGHEDEVIRQELRVICGPGGQSRLIQINATRMYDAEQFVGMLVGIVDLASREQAERDSLKAARLEATATLAGGLAHDLNNLMFVVLGTLELLKEQPHNDLRRERSLEQIERAGQRASELADQILAYAGGGKAIPRLLNLNKVIQLAAEQMPPPADRIALRLELSEQPAMMVADQRQLVQLLKILLQNAIEAIPLEGSITITSANACFETEQRSIFGTLRPGSYGCIRVRDSGVGMDAHVLQRCFEPFFTTKMIGRGMGLAAAYGIVSGYDGLLAFRSEEGKGACAELYLPLVAEKGGPPQKATPDALPLAATILLLQGDEMQRLATQVVLERQGYHVLSAAQRTEARELLETDCLDFSIAIVDLDVCESPVPEVLRKIRHLRPGLRVIFCASAPLDPADRALFGGFLLKPYGSDVLSRTVRQVLAMPVAED